MATWSDLLGDPSAAGMQLSELIERELVAVTAGDSVLAALRRMLDAGVDALCVVGPAGSLEGICTRTDILRARTRQFEQERRQQGWLRVRDAAGP
jgi:CBS domain-containing protein